MSYPKRRAVSASSGDEDIDGEISSPGSFLRDHDDTPIAVDVEEGIDVELTEEQRKKMLRKARSSGKAKSAAELEAEFALAEAGKLVGFDAEEDLLLLKIPPRIEDAVVDPDGWRMIVHDIFVENFKSYKGRQQLGPLHKNLTMIVGPNGSGKSNVIDALLFVFGFKGKRIRSPKLTSLINDQGSDSCRVEVHFLEIKDLDEEKYKISTKNKLVIARSINKREHSYYYINGQIRTAKDVVDTLHRVGIDLSHNRFLILQGEVEQIALMPPTSTTPDQDGMLEYIEDIVGTNRFKPVIDKLKYACQMLDCVASQATAAARHHQQEGLDFSGAAFSSVTYVNNVNRIKFNKLLMAQYCFREAKISKREAERTFAETSAFLQEARDQEKEVREKLEDKICEEKEKDQEYRDKQKEKIRLDHEINKARSKRERARVKEQNARAELEKILIEVEELRVQREALFDAPGAAAIMVNNMKVERDQLLAAKEECENAEATNDKKFEDKAAGPKQKVKDAENKIRELGKVQRDTEAKITLMMDDLEQMRNDVLVPENIEKEAEKLLELEKELVLLEEKDREITPLLAAAVIGKKDAKDKVDKIKGHLESLEDTRYKTKAEMNAIAFAENDNKNQSHLHKEIVKLEKAGVLKNYVGRMGELASIDGKYDTAISTVFSGFLDHYVMKTLDDSVAAIELITKRKCGRGHFFSMDRVDSKKDVAMNKPASTFPAPRLFDQIKYPDQSIRRCYYKFLGDTLVTKDIDEAKRLDQKWKGKFRYCTLDGSVLEKSGNMTGGGNPQTQSMNITGAKNKWNNDIEKKSMIYKVKVRYEQTDHEIKSIERMVHHERMGQDAANARFNELSHQKEALDNAIVGLRRKCDDARDSKERYEHRMANIQAPDVIAARIVETEQELEELRKQLIIYNKEALAANQAVAETTKYVEDMYDSLVIRNKDKKRDITARLQVVDDEIAQGESDINLNPARVAKLQAQYDDAQDRCNKKRAEVEEYAAKGNDTKSIVQQQADLLTQLTTVERECRELKEIVDEIRAAKRIVEEEFRQKRSTTEGAEEMYHQVQGLIDEMQHKEDKAQEEIDRLEDSWMQFEDLDPSTKFVRWNDPDFKSKFGSDSLVMPKDLYERWDDLQPAYLAAVADMSDDILPFSTQMLAELQRRTADLEAQCEKFRRENDDKGITQYCSLASLQLNERNKAAKSNFKANAYRKKLAQLKSERLTEFMEALTFLGSTTQMLYQMITNGGDASLKFMEGGKSSDPFDGGISFNVRPAKKSWKEIKNLSGGEKTLASLCFVFAMHHFRATPLYVMDEIDAALDQVNVRLIANYIKFSEKTRNAQFVIISLRNQMFEMGNRLIGIYKVDGITKNLVVNPDSVELSKRWGCALLEKKKREANRKVRETPDADLHQEMQSLTIGVKRPRPRLCVPTIHDLMNWEDESDDEQEQNFVGYGTVPHLPGTQSLDEVVIQGDEDPNQPGPSSRPRGPPELKRRKLLSLPGPRPLAAEERELSPEERAESPQDFVVPSPMPPMEDCGEDPEEEEEAPQSGQTTPRPESVRSGSYNFDEDDDEPVRRKPRRVVDDSSDIDDDTPRNQSPASSGPPSSRQSVSPSQSPRHSGPSTPTGGRGTRRAARKQ